MQEHIRQHPLGAWVCSGSQGFVANHIPFVLDDSGGHAGRLLGHVARANAVWQHLADGAPCVVMFMGPQAYITPSWYLGKKEHGKVVPTWNYLTVHAHGTARVQDDAAWKLDMLTRLTDAQEASRPAPWKVSDAPSDYVQKLLRGIVGIEITIDRLEGKRKLSQDEDMADRKGTVSGLMREGDCVAQALAQRVNDAIEGR